MRKVTEGDFVSAEYEGKILSGIITGAKRNPADGEWFVQLALPDMCTFFICRASDLIDCVFVGGVVIDCESEKTATPVRNERVYEICEL